MPESTIHQRITRAKRTLRAAKSPFLVSSDELSERLPSLLETIYLIFNEGYTATDGADWMRPGLCEEALRLVWILAAIVPHQAEVHGLAALLELQASRLPARRGPGGAPVLLLDQDRTRWDRLLIERGRASLRKALSILEAMEDDPLMRHHLFYGARADLLEKLCRLEAAEGDFRRAAALTTNRAESELMLDRARRCSPIPERSAES